jgi:hypothetical protein
VAAAPRFADALRRLVEHEVDFLVVGGVAAVLQGAPGEEQAGREKDRAALPILRETLRLRSS